LWISSSILSADLLNNRLIPGVLAVAVAIGLRLVAEWLAFPHPLGYDVVNYYIPMVSNLNHQWQSVADDFPLYLVLLYSVSLITGLPAHAVVVGAAVAIFGLFGFSVFNLARTVFKLGNWESLFISTFVIVQLAVLRTAWDLHRDMLALSTMFIVFGLIGAWKKGVPRFMILVALCCLTISLDRMVGLLLLFSLGAGAIIRWKRELAILAAVSSVLFVALLGPELMDDNLERSGETQGLSLTQGSDADYLVLFGVLNGLIAVPAILGFIKAKNALMRVPLILCGIASFSWVLIPETSFLVPERWVILFGIFASIFAGYFIIKMLQHRKNRDIKAGLVVAGFAVLGVCYVVMPYDSPFILFAATKPYIEDFMPVTMQFNSLDVQDNDKLLETIADINRSTEKNALIVGAKHWRGFMEIYLEGNREYKFSENPSELALAHSRLRSDVYLLESTIDTSAFEFHRLEDYGRR
jgi:hypothetical protein